MSNRLVLDLETIADPSGPRPPSDMEPPSRMSKSDTIADWRANRGKYEHDGALEAARAEWLKTSLDPTRGEIVCCSVLLEGWTKPNTWLIDHKPDSSHAWLNTRSSLLSWLSRHVHPKTVFVGANVGAFDLRYLMLTALSVGHPIARDLPWPRPGCKPWDYTDRIINVDDLWAGPRGKYGRPSSSMQIIAPFFGLDELYPDEHTGKDVQALWEAGNYDAIRAHCEADVLREREVLRLFEGV